MEEYIIHIVKSGICLGIFLIIYTLFLRKTTFFEFNRIFLMFGLIASVIIPFINYTYDVMVTIPAVSAVDNTTDIATAPTTGIGIFGIWDILITLYFAGMAIHLIRNLYTYVRISQLVIRGTKHTEESFKVVESKETKSPFSFLNYILIDSNKLSRTEKSLIIRHEQTHINQKHWIDLLCCECLILIQWFNPVAWIYVHLLKENHEFLADKSVIDSGISPALYQAVLINQEFQGPVFSFSNSFNYNKSLNRLNMMKKSKSAAWKRLAALIIIPVFGLFFWASATPNYILLQPEQLTPQSNESIADISVQAEDTISTTINSETQKLSGTPSGVAERVHVNKNKFKFVHNEDLLIFIDDVKKTAQDMKNIDPEEIDNISVLKDKASIATYGEEGKYGVIQIYTKKYVKEHLDKASDTENPSDVHIVGSGTQIKKDSSDLGIRIIGYSSMKKRNTKPSMIVIDNEKSTEEAYTKLDPNDIEQINVLKQEVAISQYGEDAKVGVIQIYTKKYAKEYPEKVQNWNNRLEYKGEIEYITPKTVKSKRLIIIDGKEVSVKEFEALSPSDIESISVLKDAGTKEYGEKGKNGVIIVSTKKKSKISN